jgi:hypothetical protein
MKKDTITKSIKILLYGIIVMFCLSALFLIWYLNNRVMSLETIVSEQREEIENNIETFVRLYNYSDYNAGRGLCKESGFLLGALQVNIDRKYDKQVNYDTRQDTLYEFCPQLFHVIGENN